MDILYYLQSEEVTNKPLDTDWVWFKGLESAPLEKSLFTFVDLILGSPYSPYYPENTPLLGNVLTRPPLAILEKAISKANKQAAAVSPKSISKRKPLAEEYGADSLFAFAQQEVSFTAVDTSWKRRGIQPSLSELQNLERRKREMAWKRKKILQKHIAQHIGKFWKMAHQLAQRRARQRTMEQKAELQAKKQRAWVRRAQQYTEAIWDRIEEAEQEEEDEELDEQMAESCDCTDELCPCEESGECYCDKEHCTCKSSICRISEAELLKKEADMDISMLMPKLKSEPKSNARRKRRRLILQAMKERSQEQLSDQEDVGLEEPPDTLTEKKEPLDEEAEGGLPQPNEQEDEAEEGTSPIQPSALLRAQLRSYQQEGFEWLMKLHKGGVAGILADEMGLGKTIQTISLLAYLASDLGIWGPHLIVVPTTLVFNWELEFQKFAPGLRVVSYMGSKKEREVKRKGWTGSTSGKRMNVCITSYTLATQDAQYLRRVSWYYLVLDEAQNLKNSSTSRWQTLLSYNAVNRLLLTGTPLQNSLMELWSLMYFIIPEIFGKHTDWQTLFSDPLKNAIEKGGVKAAASGQLHIVQDLYQILRPFLLRRLKRDVESQLPKKTEYVRKCFLTRRQKRLYDEIMTAEQDDDYPTGQDTIKNPYLKAMNLLMMLRKVCNHPHLIHETDADSEVLSPIYIKQSLVRDWYFLSAPSQEALLKRNPNLAAIKEDPSHTMRSLFSIASIRMEPLPPQDQIPQIPDELSAKGYVDKNFLPRRIAGHAETLWSVKDPDAMRSSYIKAKRRLKQKSWDSSELDNLLLHDPYFVTLRERDQVENEQRELRRSRNALWGQKARYSAFGETSTVTLNWETVHFIQKEFGASSESIRTVGKTLRPTMEDLLERHGKMLNSRFRCGVAQRIKSVSPQQLIEFNRGEHFDVCSRRAELTVPANLYEWLVSSRVSLPSVLDIEYESGKMAELRSIIGDVVARGEKCVIFTQMIGMLDILERWLMCVMKIRYVRIDGRMRMERRKQLIAQFQAANNITCLITTTRTCGIGVNLTSANNIIFYDTDWNPSMDRQAMDRCHRIGQIKDVNVYRLITYATIEENIWRKQLHKRILDQLVVDQGQFTQDHYQQAFKPADTTELIFTINSTDDLYATRELHEPVTSDGLGAAVPTTDEGNWLAEVEDAEDREALVQSRGEMGESAKAQAEEFVDDSSGSDKGGLTETPSQPNCKKGGVSLYIDQSVGELEVSSCMYEAVRFIENYFSGAA